MALDLYDLSFALRGEDKKYSIFILSPDSVVTIVDPDGEVEIVYDKEILEPKNRAVEVEWIRDVGLVFYLLSPPIQPAVENENTKAPSMEVGIAWAKRYLRRRDGKKISWQEPPQKYDGTRPG